MIERFGDAYELDERLTVLGAPLSPGDLAPPFELDHLDPETQALSTVRLADSAGRIRVLSVIPSIDTSVCHTQTCKWDLMRRTLPDGVELLTISMDLPFAQSRWRIAEHVTHAALSAHKNEQFGIDYGLLLREWRLLQRAIFVVDRDDRVAYVQYVADQGTVPDYDDAMRAIVATAEQ